MLQGMHLTHNITYKTTSISELKAKEWNLKVKCIIMDAFSITNTHLAIWDPWSMDTNLVIGKTSMPCARARYCHEPNGRYTSASAWYVP